MSRRDQDQIHPEYALADQVQTFDTSLLIAILDGTVSPREIAKRELAYRGLDATGKWVGFDVAKKVHDLT